MENAINQNQFLHPIAHALEKVSGPVCWIDEAGHIIHFNEEFIKLIGFSERKLKAASLQLLEPGLSDSTLELRWGSLRRKQVVTWESEFINANEIRFPVMLDAIQSEVEGKQLACIRVRPAASFASREAFLGGCLAKHQMAACEWNLVTNDIYVSPFFFEFFDLEKGQQVSTSNFAHLMRPHLTGTQLESLKELMHELRKKPFDIEKEIVLYHRNGTERRILASLKVLQKNGLPLLLRGYLKELTHGASSHAENFARKLMSLSKEMVFWVNSNQSIRFANPAALQALGLTEQDLTKGLKWSDIHDVPLAHFWSQANKNNLAEKPHLLHLKSKGENAITIPAECTFSFIEMEPNSMVQVSAQLTDQPQLPERTALQTSVLESMRLTKKLEQQKDLLQKELNATYENVFTLKDHFSTLLQNLQEVAQTSFPILIQGEATSDRHLVAETIHQLSRRNRYPIVKVDCKSMPSHLLEQLLFGGKKNSFSDLMEEPTSSIEAAESGTLVLDCICALSHTLQNKVLRILQEGKYQVPSEGHQPRIADVRIVATSTRDLNVLQEEGAFSKQLLEELQKGFVYNLPVQREKSSENEKLPNHANFVQNIETPQATSTTLLPKQDGKSSAAFLSSYLSDSLVSLEEKQRQHILAALKLTKGKVSGKNGAAEKLGMNPQTLFSKIRKLGIRYVQSFTEATK